MSAWICLLFAGLAQLGAPASVVAPVGATAPPRPAPASAAPSGAGASPSGAAAPATAPTETIPAFTLAGSGTSQALVVLTSGWNAIDGHLWRMERTGDAWRTVGEPVRVVVGHAGLAWGLGLHPAAITTPPAPSKREGDGRAPAGVFRLGTAAGYSEQAPAQVTWRYRPSTPASRCVDDPKSRFYNQIVEHGPDTDWTSSEVMRRRDRLYEWLVVVDHNAAAQPGAGSCIFLHVWRGKESGTLGCTAMEATKLVEVLRWLRPEASPVLIQMPRETHTRLAAAWALPSP